MLTVQNNAIELQVIDGKVVTTSLRVAEDFGKEHKNVMQVINTILDAGIAGLNIKLGSYKDKNNQDRPMFLIDRKGFSLLVSRFTGIESLIFMDRYTDAFEMMEAKLLEQAKAPQIPTSFAEALQLAATQAFTIIEQQKQLEEAKPAVALLDKIIANDKTYSLGEAAKLLGWGRNTFIAFLRQQNILDSNNIAYQTFIDRGYFEIKQTIVNRSNGDVDNHVVSRTNDKGIAYISKIMDRAAEALTI